MKPRLLIPGSLELGTVFIRLASLGDGPVVADLCLKGVYWSSILIHCTIVKH